MCIRTTATSFASTIAICANWGRLYDQRDALTKVRHRPAEMRRPSRQRMVEQVE